MDRDQCFHSDPPASDVTLPADLETVGLVVCVHVFGVGVYLAEQEAWGHVNTPELAPNEAGKVVLPSIGERLPLRVLGYSGTHHHLRLAGRDVRFP